MAYRLRRGVGAYPDDPYFDPQRPSWLPYWIDDSTESQAKYAFLSGTGVTAQEIVNPGSVYVAPPAPPPVGAPSGPDLTVPPASGQTAQATVDQIISDQAAAQKVQASGFFSSLNSVVNPAGGTNWLLWGAVGLGVFALVAMGGGSPGRYGR